MIPNGEFFYGRHVPISGYIYLQGIEFVLNDYIYLPIYHL